MIGKNARLVGKILGELAVSLPLPLIAALADGKITREELQGLIREITVVVAKVIVTEYRDSRTEIDEDDIELDSLYELED